jgi:hypothetical protein
VDANSFACRCPITGPLDVPNNRLDYTGNWRANERRWNIDQIAFSRINLASTTPSLVGTLQRHGLAMQNDITNEAIERHAREIEVGAPER